MLPASEVQTKPDKCEACGVNFILSLWPVTSNDHTVFTGPQAITSTNIVDQKGV